MLRIATFNANGIRSAGKKGFWEWFDAQDADILCVQELKAQEADLGEEIRRRGPWRSWLHCAQKKGYSGTGIWSRIEPENVVAGFDGGEFDAEGRCVRLDFPGLSVLSVYFPSGTSGDERQLAKYRFLEAFPKYLDELRADGREVVFCADVNIAHKEIDLRNWKGNLDHSGFLPEERAWLDRMFGERGWTDVFRRLDPRPEQYTWWSQRGRARARNVGWRIDYQIATRRFAESARRTFIYPDEKFSDHAPLVVDYEWDVHAA